MSEPDFISSKALSSRWRMAETTLRRWRQLGIGPAFLKLRGRVLYRLPDIERYERDSLHQSTKPEARR